ncbi:MAG: 30S ribosomal protein S2, partial [Candidatus Paceibacterota bacterium]
MNKKNNDNEVIEEVTPKPEYSPVEVTLESLLASGAHFGHKVDRWNPKMLPYIYGKKGDVHVINLDITV